MEIVYLKLTIFLPFLLNFTQTKVNIKYVFYLKCDIKSRVGRDNVLPKVSLAPRLPTAMFVWHRCSPAMRALFLLSTLCLFCFISSSLMHAAAARAAHPRSAPRTPGGMARPRVLDTGRGHVACWGPWHVRSRVMSLQGKAGQPPSPAGCVSRQRSLGDSDRDDQNRRGKREGNGAGREGET